MGHNCLMRTISENSFCRNHFLRYIFSHHWKYKFWSEPSLCESVNSEESLQVSGAENQSLDNSGTGKPAGVSCFPNGESGVNRFSSTSNSSGLKVSA